MAMLPTTQKQTLRWLWLGVSALAIAGLFAIILVAARTPQIAKFGDIFTVALVVHVDLSVLFWFLCVACLGWSRMQARHGVALPYWQSGGFYTVAAATAAVALSPIDPHWEALKSNYIPVLNNFPFILGLGLLAAGMVVMLLPLARMATPSRWKHTTTEETLFFDAGITTAIALVAFAFSARLLPADLPHEMRFNQLFWAGGHILQFTFTLLMMAGWVALAHMFLTRPVPRPLVRIASLICVGAALKSFAGFTKHPFDTSDFMVYQTRVMIELGGTGAGILGLYLLYRLLFTPGITRQNRAYVATLVCSMVLFVAGGALGLMIRGENVTVPAHYHGAIIGITLALMGYAYSLLPHYGYKSVAATRLALWQPIVLCIGQLMHIGGLAYSGGYGVLRKTPAGETPNLAPDVKAALGFMGMGGLLAIIGGLLFVVVMVRALRKKQETV